MRRPRRGRARGRLARRRRCGADEPQRQEGEGGAPDGRGELGQRAVRGEKGGAGWPRAACGKRPGGGPRRAVRRAGCAGGDRPGGGGHGAAATSVIVRRPPATEVAH